MLTTSIDTDTIAGREALQIRPLIEFPRLRAAMGLEVAQCPELPKHTAASAKRAQRSTTKQSHAKQSHPRQSSKRLTGVQGRRFDRRALLESGAA
jgi:hypothetical protein